jgi:hypothetical protein
MSHTESTQSSDISEADLQHAVAGWILKIKEGHRIPQAVMESIISDVQSLHKVQYSSRQHILTFFMLQIAMSGVSGIMRHGLECAGVSAEVIETVLTGLTVETQYTNIFKGLESHHKQHSYFKKHFQ